MIQTHVQSRPILPQTYTAMPPVMPRIHAPEARADEVVLSRGPVASPPPAPATVSPLRRLMGAVRNALRIGPIAPSPASAASTMASAAFADQLDAQPVAAVSPATPERSTEPRAILPDGREIAPDSFSGGYHGTTDVPPEVALQDGLPERGTDWRLKEHSESAGNSAFRGTTEVASDPVSGNGAAYWAGEGGWVYEIRGVPTWDVNSDLEGRVQTAAGFRGNLMFGENERAIPARVPPERIARYGKVVEDSMGNLRVREWVANPGFRPRTADP